MMERTALPEIVSRLRSIGVVLALCGAVCGSAAWADGEKPPVSEAADRTLREAADFLGSAKAFMFSADIVFDHVLKDPA